MTIELLFIIWLMLFFFFVLGYIAGSAGRKIEYKDRVVPGENEVLIVNADNFKIAVPPSPDIPEAKGFMQSQYVTKKEEAKDETKLGVIKRPTAKDLELHNNKELRDETKEMEKAFSAMGLEPNPVK